MISDTLGNIFAVKAFAKEEQEARELKHQSDDFMKKWIRTSDFQNLRYETVMSPLYVATNVVWLLASVYLLSIGDIGIGELALIFAYYSHISRVLWDINNVYRTFESRLIDAAEFIELVLQEPDIQDVKNAKDLIVSHWEIVFGDVSFSYPKKSSEWKEEEESFFRNFSLYIKSGEKIWLVGPSWGGKSTITKLLLRFIDIQSGSIRFDDQDISQVTQKSLRENISYIPQEPLLFHRSLLDNIRYGKEDATLEEVIHAAQLAHAHEFIIATEDWYETLVGERGIKLSWGQKQRIAIARAILKDTKIVILDEATSALDSESEKYIQDGLSELLKHKTAIIIAHRLSTIKHLDRILVLDNGAIIEEGKHDDLIQKNWLYAKLWSHQSGEFIE